MNVSTVMTREPVTCRPEDSESHAARRMWDNDCGVLPVVDSGGRLVGIVTDRDLCMGAYTQGRALGEMDVSHAMSTDLRSCRPGEELDDALETMSDARVRRLPVVDEQDRLVGILSLNDVFREIADMPDGKDKKRLMKSAVECMAAICEPRQQAVVS